MFYNSEKKLFGIFEIFYEVLDHIIIVGNLSYLTVVVKIDLSECKFIWTWTSRQVLMLSPETEAVTCGVMKE